MHVREKNAKNEVNYLRDMQLIIIHKWRVKRGVVEPLWPAIALWSFIDINKAVAGALDVAIYVLYLLTLILVPLYERFIAQP